MQQKNINLPASAEPSLPGLAAPADLAASFHTFREGMVVVIDRMPTTSERRSLVDRRDHVFVRLRGLGMSMTERETARAMLTAFLGGFPITQAAGFDLEGTINAYLIQLNDVPLWALEKGIDNIRTRKFKVRGKDGEEEDLGRDYPIPAFRVLDAANAAAEAARNELAQIERVLSATEVAREEVSDEERKIVGAKIKLMADETRRRLGSCDDDVARAQRETAAKAEIERINKMRLRQDEEFRREYARLGCEPQFVGGFLVSPGLAMKMGMVPRPRREHEGDDR